MPVGSPNRNSDLMMVQSGPKPWPCGNPTTQLPRQSFQNAYTDTISEAITVPIAEPTVPNAGIGPNPRNENRVEDEIEHRQDDAEHHRRSRVACRAQRATDHEEHHHAAAEHKHDAQERQRLGLYGGRRVHQIEQPRRAK